MASEKETKAQAKRLKLNNIDFRKEAGQKDWEFDLSEDRKRRLAAIAYEEYLNPEAGDLDTAFKNILGAKGHDLTPTETCYVLTRIWDIQMTRALAHKA